MSNSVLIKKKLLNFNKIIKANPDKSLSIRWAIMAAQAIGRSKGYNILNSEDVNCTLKLLKKLGVKLKKTKNYCEIEGLGLNGFNFKNNVELNCENSGTLARLICGTLVKSNKTVILKGDASLSKRDFSRVIKPLNLFGVKVLSNSNRMPIKIKGTNFLKPIKFDEVLGSAQVKSCIMLAALNTPKSNKN
jgi:5-enolpyruvylshikimate-3-phosphate synthase